LDRFNAFGASLAAFGAVFALFSHMMVSSIPLTALGLGILILGLSILITPTEPIPRGAVRGLLEGSALSLEAILEMVDAPNRGYYVPHGDGRIYVHIPLAGDRGPIYPETPTGSMVAEKDGEPYIILLPPASELVRMGDLPEDLESAISEALTGLTELCESVEVARGEGVALRVRGPRALIGAGRFRLVMGSLEASVAACIAAARMGRPVRIASEEDEGKTRRIILEAIP
jgi:hypothetical protein